MTEYHKLVRDLIPDIIRADGEVPETRTLAPDEYREALHAKLHEEATEVAQAANRDELLKECADVLEVLAALLAEEGAKLADVEPVRLARQKKRGGFEKRIFLVRTTKL